MSEKNVASVKFVNSKSEKIFNLKEHALIGISPFNSYYSEENLKRLFAWGLNLNHFKEVNIFIPDGISAYTLQAMGYSEEKAKKKTKLHDNNLKNKAIRALVANNVVDVEANNMMVFCSDLMKSESYLKFYDNYKKLYESNEDFKEGCLATSKMVLASKGFQGDMNDEAVGVAAKYFIAELPVYLNTPEILNVSSSLYVYKDLPSEFLMKIYNKESQFSSHMSLKQGYLAVDFREEVL
ncbi:MAG: tRNA-dependent cyclodipeptide synthase [Endomicrobium sp.]|jgi:cyclo(L-tyrosyl-L-tyrosyl) synthase|nr:tRNA-dependent cyclodipeptide synthase [Endomicrobium sp.]